MDIKGHVILPVAPSLCKDCQVVPYLKMTKKMTISGVPPGTLEAWVDSLITSSDFVEFLSFLNWTTFPL